MIKNNIKIAFRNLIRGKGYSMLNIAGLSIGLACAFLITVWIFDELDYDRFHESGDQLYRVLRHTRFGNDIFTEESAPFPLFEAIKEYPEVENIAYTTSTQDFILKKNELAAHQQGLYANQDFFNIFSWNLIEGNRANVLNDPSSIVISASLADRYFGNAWRKENNIIGRSIQIGYHRDYLISGVFENVPHNSSLQFDFVLPIEVFIGSRDTKSLNNWNNSNFNFYVKIKEGFDGANLSAKITDLQNNHIKGFQSNLFLQPYTDQHMYSSFEDGWLVTSRVEYYVKIFSIIALIIILIASINFMNLATARSIRRAKEIGVRKAVGAIRKLLIGQFMAESMLAVFFAFTIGFILTVMLLPVFNQLTGKEVQISDFWGTILLLFGAISLLTAFVSGIYPALYLSSFNSVSILRDTFHPGGGNALFRKGLIVLQFAMSILLIIGTVTVYQQIQYIQSKNLGLNRENVISLHLEGKMSSQREAIINELRQLPGVQSVTTASESPLDIRSSTHTVSWRGKDQNSKIEFHVLNVNYDFLETMKMELISGRYFNPDFSSEPVNCIVNETAADILGLKNPIGEPLNFSNNETGNIVGVVRNFHMSSFYSEIEPTIICLRPQQTWQLLVRTEADHTKEALTSLKNVHEQFNPEYPFEYHFLDESFHRMYHSEIIIGKLIGYFTAFALFIACLGLLGLAMYSAEVHTKEIGIRKVNGAKVSEILVLLNKDFVLWVVTAFVIACPVAYFVLQKWLENFAYKTEISWWIFALAGVMALVIALFTVSWQSWRAASRNPVEALRYE